jgi:hypothetical protein
MTFYQDMQNVASSLLKEFNQGKIQYVKVVPGNGPKDAPGAPTETIYNVNATAHGVKFKYINSSTIVSTDLQATLAIDGRFIPDMKGFMLVDGARYKIVAVQPIPPAGIPVANVVIFRK